MLPDVTDLGPEDPLPTPPTAECCAAFFDALENLLEWLWDQIGDCVGEGEGPCGEMRRYVSFTPPIVQPNAPNVLAIYVPQNAIVSEDVQGFGRLRATATIELWEGCYPIVDAEGNLPSALQFHEANRHLYAHGYKLYSTLAEAVRGGSIDTIMSPCSRVTLGPLQPVPNETGIAVGWRTSITFTA